MKQTKRKSRISLTLMFAAMVFVILLISLVLGVCAVYLMVHLGWLSAESATAPDLLPLLLFVGAISLVIGSATAVLAVRIHMKPVSRGIDVINRVAGGDFKARIELRGALSSLPALCELTDSFNTMAQELENTELLRSGFINDFSHEFKTPIVSIAGFAKLLRRGGLSEAQKQEYLAIIEEESLRLAAMANHVMDLTKVENQTILTEVSEFNLSEQLRGCVLLLEGKWAQKGILPELNFREHRIHGNEELLKQVWINLLDNAIKFSEERSEIRVEIAETPEGLAVSVTNYGPDIPPESMDKIWRKFYQAEESHASLGSGIGLAIVKRAVELHRGKVSATSQNGVTTFTVELPK